MAPFFPTAAEHQRIVRKHSLSKHATLQTSMTFVYRSTYVYWTIKRVHRATIRCWKALDAILSKQLRSTFTPLLTCRESCRYSYPRGAQCHLKCDTLYVDSRGFVVLEHVETTRLHIVKKGERYLFRAFPRRRRRFF